MTATTTAPPVTETLPVIAPFRVDRVAGLTTATLDLDATSVDLVCAELDRVDREVQAMSSAVSDLLYQLVPALGDDTATRRVVLAVRRTCGGGGSRIPDTDKARTVSAAVGTHLDAGAQRLFDSWFETWERRERLLIELETNYESEVERANETLRQVLTDADLATGIAQASPYLGQSLRKAELQPGKRAARSIGGYVMRAARKTSPFSFLTAVTTTAEAPAPIRESVTVSQTYVVSWLDALAADEELLSAFELEPLWTPGRSPITDSVLVPEVARHDGFTWRRDRQTRLAELGRVLTKLQYLGRRPAAEYLAAVGGADAFATIRRLVEVGVIRVVAPWGYGEEHRLLSLVQTLEGQGSVRAREVAASLRGLHEQIGAIGATRGEDRARELLRVQGHAEELIGRFGVSAEQAAFTVYSDTRSPLEVGELGTHVSADLLSLGRAIRPMIFRSHVYDEVRDRFVAGYGSGGTCPDLFGFLTTVVDDGAGLSGIFAAASRDEQGKGRPSERSELPVGRTSAAPTTSVLYQLAGTDIDSVREGEFRLIVNQFHAGTGSLVSRFHGLDGGGLRRALRAWADAVYPDARVVEFIASSGVNDMQSACEGTFPRLRWPTELPVTGDLEGSVDLDALLLRHDPELDVLEFVTRDGSLVAPVYMGLVPAHMLGGAERILSILADPWVNGASALLRKLPAIGDEADRSLAVARQQHGRIVTKRASWTIRAEGLPRPERHESEAAYLRRLNTWRRSEEIPEHVFVRGRCTGAGLEASRRKPYWVSFLSPHAVAQMLATIDEQTLALTFVEVLPGDTDLWLADAHGNPYVAEHLTHLRWERPSDIHDARQE